jgi:glutathione S-transferase
MLKFYSGAGSPYAWPVHLALLHKGIPFELTVLSFGNKDHLKPEFVALNPRHRVPAIVDDDFVLWESNAILEYLDERFPEGPALFPMEMQSRARVRRLMHEITCYVSPIARAIGSEIFRKPAAEWNREEIATQRALLAHELAHFEAAMHGDFFEGELSAADFRLYPNLATLKRYDLREPSLGFAAMPGPKLQAAMRRIEALPYFEQTYPPHWR